MGKPKKRQESPPPDEEEDKEESQLEQLEKLLWFYLDLAWPGLAVAVILYFLLGGR